MTVIHFALDLYFAMVLATAGLAKAEHPAQLAATLRRQRLLPRWSVTAGSWLFPWVEVILAGSLISGLASVLTAVVVLALFTSFLLMKGLLLASRRPVDCGCYGGKRVQVLDGADVATAALLTGLAVVHLCTALPGEPTPNAWRLAAAMLFSGTACWFAWRIVARRRFLAGWQASQGGAFTILEGSVKHDHATPATR